MSSPQIQETIVNVVADNIIVEDVSDDEKSLSPSVSLLCENHIEMFPSMTFECSTSSTILLLTESPTP